jgi:hypothetical protein
VLDHGRKRRDPCHKGATGATFAHRRAMTEHPKQQRKAREQRRLSAALRDNLRRRKAQEKGREKGRETGCENGPVVAESTVEHAGTAHDSAGIGTDKLER